MNTKTSERLKELREEMKLTQAALAEKMGVARMTIVNYENGKNIPETDFLIKASEFFQCSTDYLLDLNEAKNNERAKQLHLENEKMVDVIKKYETQVYSGVHKHSVYQLLTDVLNDSSFYFTLLNILWYAEFDKDEAAEYPSIVIKNGVIEPIKKSESLENYLSQAQGHLMNVCKKLRKERKGKDGEQNA